MVHISRKFREFLHEIRASLNYNQNKIILIRDGRSGEGRKFYWLLNRCLMDSGIQVYKLSDVQSLTGRISGQLQLKISIDNIENGRTLFEDHSYRNAVKMVDILYNQLDGAPFVLSMGKVSRWNSTTKSFVSYLINNCCGNPCRAIARKGVPNGFIVALGEAFDSSDDMKLPGEFSDIDGDSKVIRIDKPAEYIAVGGAITTDSKAHLAIKLCQLSFIPLKIDELKRISGIGSTEELKRAGLDFSVTGQKPNEEIILFDDFVNSAVDVDALPRKQLKNYHEILFEVFKLRSETPFVVAARFYHAVKSGNVEGIIRFYKKGIEEIIRRGRVEQAIALLKEALEDDLHSNKYPAELLSIRRMLANLLWSSSQPLQTYHSLCGADLKKLKLSDWYLIARSAIEAGKLTEAKQAINRVMNFDYVPDDFIQKFRLLQVAIDYFEGRFDATVEKGNQMLAEERLDIEDRLYISNIIGRVHLSRSHFKKAEKIFKNNCRVAQSAGFDKEAVIAKINGGICKIRLGHYSIALKYLNSALKEARKKSFCREEAIALENIATIYHLKRNYTKAFIYYTRAFDIIKYLDCSELISRISNNIGELYLHFGQLDRAGQMLEFSRLKREESSGSLVQGEGLLLEGRIEFFRGNTGDALKRFNEAENFFQKHKSRYLEVEAKLWKVRCMLKMGKIVEADKELMTCKKDAESFCRLKGTYLLCLGKVHMEKGKASVELLRKGYLNFKKVDDKEGQIECLLDIGKQLLLMGRKTEAKKVLKKADEIDSFMKYYVPADLRRNLAHMPTRIMLSALKKEVERSDGKSGNESSHHDIIKGEVSLTHDDGGNAESTEDVEEPAELDVMLKMGIGLHELKERVEKKCIQQAFKMANGNITKAAEILKMKRPRLSQLVKYYGIKREYRKLNNKRKRVKHYE